MALTPAGGDFTPRTGIPLLARLTNSRPGRRKDDEPREILVRSGAKPPVRALTATCGTVLAKGTYRLLSGK